MRKPKISIDEHRRIIELYESGLSTLKIGELYGVRYDIIRNILIKNSIQLRDNSHKGRIYTLNENYFDDINTNNKAYILGLLYADGCNYLKLNHIKLELQERDKDILDKINIELQSNRQLKFIDLHSKNQNWQNTYRLDIVNKHMSESLNNIGMVPNKSLILKFPNFLQSNLFFDFLRGYLDGDGHIEWNKTRFITIASTKEFCEAVKTILKDQYDIDSSIKNTGNKESNTKLLYICGKNNIKKFLDYIYKDAELYIQRKYDVYQMICDEMNINNSLSA